MTTLKDSSKLPPLRCPFCGLEGEKPEDKNTAIAVLAFHIDSKHYISRERICYQLALEIAEKQEPSVPVSKIEEKIKDLEDILEMEKAEFPSGMKITPDVILMQNEINNLKSLLPKKEII